VDWPGLVRRYVWDEEKTPYLVRAERLTGAQARSELFVYAFLLAILASVVSVVAVLGQDRAGTLATPVVALYAATILVGAIVLGTAGSPAAAWYCATAPVAAWLAALTGAFRPGMEMGERLVLAVASALWMAYAVRVVRIARRLHRRG
jgi:hypothetical protein